MKRRMKKTSLLALFAVAALAACDVQDGQYAVPNTGSTKATTAAAAAAPAVVAPAAVQIFEGTPSQAYTVVGPLDISVNKLTAFHPNPTREAAIARLQEAAAELGADAVINVSVGEVKVVPLSWGARQATGTAVKF